MKATIDPFASTERAAGAPSAASEIHEAAVRS